MDWDMNEWLRWWGSMMVIGAFESFILIPLHGKWLEKNCKRDNCDKCKMWNCTKWHKDIYVERKNRNCRSYP